MKKLVKYVFIPLVACFSACTWEEMDFDSTSNELVAIMESDGSGTRTYLSDPGDGTRYPLWAEDDLLAVYVDNMVVAERFTLTSGAGTRSATFSGAGKGRYYMAIYPYGLQEKREGDLLTLTLPANQSYIPDSFGEGASPMLAVSRDETLQFKNLCALLKVSLTGSTSVQSIVFTANDSRMAVSGMATVRTDRPENPVLSMAEGGSPSVRLITEGVVLSETDPTDFFIVLPPGSYKGGFTLKVKTSEGTVTRSTDEDIVFERSQMRSVPVFACTDAAVDLEDIPDNMVCYTTDDDKVLQIYLWSDMHILSHTYEDGVGRIVFDRAVTTLEGDLFSYRSNVKDVYLPASIDTIGYRAFQYSSVQSVHFSDHLLDVDSRAFNQCPRLERFFGPPASSDGKGLLIDRELVAYVGVVDPVFMVPEEARSARPYCVFMNLTDEALMKVKEIVYPEGFVSGGRLVRTGYDTDPQLTNLDYITIPSTFENTEDTYGLFGGCPHLKKFKGNSRYIWDDGNCLVDDTGCLFGYAGDGITEYAIPEGVLTIAAYVLDGKDDLRGLSFPSTTQRLGKPVMAGKNFSYFYGPFASEDGKSLVMNGRVIVCVPTVQEYVSPEGVKSFDFAVFLASSVKKITIRDCVTDMGDDTFSWVDEVETIILSRSLRSLGRECFGDNPQLRSIYFRSPVPPTCGKTTGKNMRSDLVIYVPKGSLNAYMNSADWSFLPRNFVEYEPEDLDLPDWYVSTEYSQDGVVEVLQQASKGQGIDLVLMGDAFSDRQITNGTYGKVMSKMADAFFSEEPYKSYRNLFNVYTVNVVSESEGYAHAGQALGTQFLEGTRVKGNDQACLNYARKALSDSRMDNALVIVAMDSTTYAGTCYMYNSSVYAGDWGEGPAVAYFPLGESDETLARLVHHEAGGHGFAKLADEYAYETNGAIPAEEVEKTQRMEPSGWWKNVDFTDDPSRVKWNHFLSDERYQYDGLGVYPGAMTYWSGVWRPSGNSIMRDNTGGFNAPSREAIWYRIHKLAYGSDWEYDYEAFVSYDTVNRKKSASGATYAPIAVYPPLHEPVVKECTWRDVVKGSD